MTNSNAVINVGTSCRTGSALVSALAFAALLSACGAGAETEFTGDEAVEETQQPITGGALVPAGSDPMVVKLGLPTGQCTGTKLTSTWYLTAAHCNENLQIGDVISVTNDEDGVFDDHQLTVTRTEVHPTYFQGFDVRSFYDVGLIRTAEVASDIPSLLTSGLLTTYVTPGMDGALTAYGCDLNSNNDGKKQYGEFVMGSRNDLELDTFWSIGGQPPEACSGDSGGPLFIWSANAWRVAGVVTGPGITFARTGNVRQWILSVLNGSPGYNQYANGEKGFFSSKLSRQCIGISGASVANLALSKQYFCDGRTAGELGTFDHQYWELTDMGSGRWRIRNTNSIKCLGVENDSTANNARINQQTCSSSTSQLWTVGGTGTYRRLVNVNSGRCINVADSTNGTQLRQGTCSSSTLGANWVFSD